MAEEDFYDPLKHQSQAPEVVEHTPDYGYQEEKQILAPEKEIAPHHNLQPDTEYNVHGRAQWWTQPSGKICGLRPVTFWLSLALAVVIVVGALAGGVGGALATRHASSNATSSTAVDATGTAGSSVSSSPSTGSKSSFTTTSTSAATSGIAVASTGLPDPSASSLPEEPNGYDGCPKTNDTTYTTSGATFTRYCDLLWSTDSQVIYMVSTKTLDLCIDQCALYNVDFGGKGGNGTCNSVFFYGDNADFSPDCALHKDGIGSEGTTASLNVAGGVLKGA